MKCREANLHDPASRETVLEILDDYARASSIQSPLKPGVKARLMDDLTAHPTTKVYLSEVDGRPIGTAVCFLGFSTFHSMPFLSIDSNHILAFRNEPL